MASYPPNSPPCVTISHAGNKMAIGGGKTTMVTQLFTQSLRPFETADYSQNNQYLNIQSIQKWWIFFPIGTRAQAKKVATTEFAAAEKKSENGKFLIKAIKDKEGVLKLETIPLVLMKWFQKWKVLWRFCKTRFSW